MTAEVDGIITRTGEAYEVVFRRPLKHPIDKVWAALTLPERIADWFTEMRFDPDARLGASVELNFDDPPYRMTGGRVVAFDPPRLIAWTWPDESHPNSVVRCELAPAGSGCILTFSQNDLGRRHIAEVAGGWHTYLEGLDAAIDGVRTPWSAPREAVHAKRYAAAIARL